MAKNDRAAKPAAKPAVKKLKIIITVVDRPKADFYMDVIGGFEVNCQLLLSGRGTASSELVDLLGLNPEKAVILSVAREDAVPTIMSTLEDKFQTVRNGKGVAFAIPLSSIIGVNLYQFMSNNRMKRGE